MKKDRLPPIPIVGASHLIDENTLQRRIEQGDYLLVIAGEHLHSRVVKLSRSLLGRHLVRGWDLAVIEVAVYAEIHPKSKPEYLLVPHIRGALVPEVRQLVTVIVEDERTRIEVQSEPPPQVGSTRQIWSEDDAFAEFEQDNTPPPVRAVAETFRRLRTQYPDVRIDLGSGQVANLILKRSGNSLLEITASGYVACRPRRFARALGDELAVQYHQQLQALFRKPLTSVHPGFSLDPSKDGPLLGKILELLESILARANESRAV